MRTSNDYRIYLERLIISACLQENGYPQIAGMVTSKNFSTVYIEKDVNLNHQQIFSACERLYPLKPIDRATLWNYIGRNKEVGRILCEFQTYVCSTDNIKEHALLLIELCIMESFEDFLNSLTVKESSSYKLKLAISEFLKTKLNNEDVFDLIAKAEVSLGRECPEVLSSIRIFRTQIDSKVLELKDQIQIDRLFYYLKKNSLYLDVNGNIGIEHLCKILKSISKNETMGLAELTKLLAIQI